jgi:hypothetical protein
LQGAGYRMQVRGATGHGPGRERRMMGHGCFCHELAQIGMNENDLRIRNCDWRIMLQVAGYRLEVRQAMDRVVVEQSF